MKVSLKRSDVFIPDWENNLEQPDELQIKFHYRFLGSGDRKRYIYQKPIEFTQNVGKAEGQIGKIEMIQDGRGLALAMVTRIENLEVEYEDGTEAVVSSIADFYKAALPDLAAMIEGHLIEATAVADPKNS